MKALIAATVLTSVFFPVAASANWEVHIVGFTPYASSGLIGMRLSVKNAGKVGSPAGAQLAYTCADTLGNVVGGSVRKLPAIGAGATVIVDDPAPVAMKSGTYRCQSFDAFPLTSTYTIPLPASTTTSSAASPRPKPPMSASDARAGTASTTAVLQKPSAQSLSASALAAASAPPTPSALELSFGYLTTTGTTQGLEVSGHLNAVNFSGIPSDVVGRTIRVSIANTPAVLAKTDKWGAFAATGNFPLLYAGTYPIQASLVGGYHGKPVSVASVLNVQPGNANILIGVDPAVLAHGLPQGSPLTVFVTVFTGSLKLANMSFSCSGGNAPPIIGVTSANGTGTCTIPYSALRISQETKSTIPGSHGVVVDEPINVFRAFVDAKVAGNASFAGGASNEIVVPTCPKDSKSAGVWNGFVCT